jgi:hypothetical protein
MRGRVMKASPPARVVAIIPMTTAVRGLQTRPGLLNAAEITLIPAVVQAHPAAVAEAAVVVLLLGVLDAVEVIDATGSEHIKSGISTALF